MFNFLKRKTKEDPILKELQRQDLEIKELMKGHGERQKKLDKEINDAENALRKLGYTDEDFERLKQKSRLKVVK